MDWRRALVLLVVVIASCAQEVPSDAGVPSEEPLIRCKRPLCENVCEFGQQQDRNGCPRCECLEDPCKDMVCPLNQRCVPLPCQDYPCVRVEARCGIRPMACPLRDCSGMADCPFGHLKDVNGCDLCECKDDPCQGYACEYAQRCQSFNPCSEGKQCDFEPRCVVDDGHEIPRDSSCSEVMCLMACQFGFKKDSNGCEICSCSDDPCNNHDCAAHEICRPQAQDCYDEDGNCPIYPSCVAKPLCHHMQEHPDLLTVMNLPVSSKDTRKVRCQADSGEFEYMQCGETSCWCVDDRGVEIPDTRHLKPLSDEPSTCVRNRTHSVDVRFNMTHNLPNLEDHLTKLTEVTVTKVTEWLSIEKDYVTGMELISKSVDIVEVHFQVVRGVDDEVDLPTAIVHLHYEIHIQKALLNYDDQVFTPDPSSITAQHLYEPMLPSGGGIRTQGSSEENSSEENMWEKGHDASREKHGHKGYHKSWYRKCFGKNSPTIIVVVTGLFLFIMLVFGLVCVCKRRRTRRYDMQKANLAFANDLYSTLHKVGGDEEKVKLESDIPAKEKELEATLA